MSFNYNVNGYGTDYMAAAKKTAEELLKDPEKLKASGFADIANNSIMMGLDGDASSLSVDELATAIYFADNCGGKEERDGKVGQYWFKNDFDEMEKYLKVASTDRGAKNVTNLTNIFNQVKGHEDVNAKQQGANNANSNTIFDNVEASTVEATGEDYMNALEG
ncbi:MAG: hypothetical protein PHV68_10315, partial [Candidatus Gastranaerophilales bacterium]|nr:hypothetical protein [Candidatus Gastranaerophilales bacterium]